MERTPQLEALARRLAEKHRIPETDIVHPTVIFKNNDGTTDEFMMRKMREEPNYVPYCLVGIECGRVRRRVWGFECPTCGNKMNYDFTRYDGNRNVEYVSEPPDPIIATQGMPVPGEYWKFGKLQSNKEVAEHRLKYADREEWNKQVELRKQAKKEKKGDRHAK
jgi:hypothetical protein